MVCDIALQGSCYLDAGPCLCRMLGKNDKAAEATARRLNISRTGMRLEVLAGKSALLAPVCISTQFDTIENVARCVALEYTDIDTPHAPRFARPRHI